MNCIIFLSSYHLKLLEQELKDPNYANYHIFYITDISDDVIRKIAEFDIHNKVLNFKRIFLYYYSENGNMFHSNINTISTLFNNSVDLWSVNEKLKIKNME